MSLLLYAVVEAADVRRPDPIVGVEGQAVRPVLEQSLAALVSEHERRPAFSTEVAWAFDAVLEAAMEQGAVLPVRFGTMLDDEEAVRAVLRGRSGELGEGLRRVRGAVELALRARWAAGVEAPPPRSGSEYLLGRVDRHREAERLRARVEESLGAVARESRYHAGRARAPLRAAYLVDRERTEELLDRVAALQRELGEAELSCTGPWPPYSFARVEAHA